ncbi:MAG: hypothetical protein ACLUHL_04785 [Dysosmobacter welbionis]
MKKCALFFSAAAVLCILAGLTAYHRSFPLDAGLNGLEPAALQWFNRGKSVPCEADQLELYQPVTVGRLTYYPLVLDGRLGYLCLSRGFTGRYKFDHSGRGTGSFRNGVVESDGEQMLLFEGRNGDGRIARAVFSLEGDGPYALDIPASPVFLVSPGGGHRPHRTCQYRGYCFYDSQGREITEEFDLSGGAIQ